MRTAARYFVLVLCALAAAGCASYEGSYSPACVAYAGDTIELEGGHFVWDKFTDQVIVSEAGAIVDQFPDYPMRGRYEIEGQKLRLEPDNGTSPHTFYLQQDGDNDYILTADQFKAWKETGQRDNCALVSGGPPHTTIPATPPTKTSTPPLPSTDPSA